MSFTKKGPGRRPQRGRGADRGRGFKGVTFAPARPLSIFHPEVRAKLHCAYERGDMREYEATRKAAG